MNGRTLWNAKRERTIQELEPGTPAQGAGGLVVAGVILGAFLLVGAISAPLCAQSYPNKPIRLIVPMTGGAVDILGRIIGPKLAEQLGQPVVIENRPGAGGNIGVEVVAKAKPDGYTIIQCGASFTISPSLYKKLNYDPIRDFEPISPTGQIPNFVAIRPSFPVKNLKELIEYAKANPRKLNYGSSGIGTGPHLAIELLKSLAKIDIVHVPYKGAGPTLVGLMSGEVDMIVSTVPTALSQIQEGKVRALVVLSKERVSSLPSVPTAKEAGVDNWEATSWFGLLAPAGTPRDIVNRLNAEWLKIAAMPDILAMMKKAGIEPLSSTPEKFSEFLKAETERWSKVIKEANIPRID